MKKGRLQVLTSFQLSLEINELVLNTHACLANLPVL